MKNYKDDFHWLRCSEHYLSGQRHNVAINPSVFTIIYKHCHMLCSTLMSKKNQILHQRYSIPNRLEPYLHFYNTLLHLPTIAHKLYNPKKIMMFVSLFTLKANTVVCLTVHEPHYFPYYLTLHAMLNPKMKPVWIYAGWGSSLLLSKVSIFREQTFVLPILQHNLLFYSF